MITETNSSLQTFQTCPRQYYYKYIMNLCSKGYSTPLGVGIIFHMFVEHFFTGEEFHHEEFVQNMIDGNVDATLTIKDDFTLAQAMFAAWEKFYADGTINKSNALLEAIDIEAVWTYPVGGFHHTGRRDGYLKNKTTGLCYLYELKTKGKGIEYLPTLGIDAQLLSNIHAIQKEGKPLDGIIYDVIFKPSIRHKKSETYAEYKQRVLGLYLIEPEVYFQRTIMDLPSERILDEHIKELEHQAQVINLANQNKIFHKQTRACLNRFLGRCNFIELCTTDKIDNSEYIKTYYDKKQTKHTELA